ncbi:MAG: DUF2807 domain-containing protein [Bacteroidales bacterium]|nr:DUF2807 domain-containing protein [Bacteroidales bacterium]
MKKCFVLLSALLVLTSCDFDRIRLSGHLVSKDFAIEGTYSKLDVSSAFKVTVCDTVSQITVTTDEVIMPKVEVIKQGDELSIRLKPRFVSINLRAKMEVILPYNPDLTEVELSGASSIHSSFPLKGQLVEIDLSGASDYYGDIEADKVEIDLSGASNYYGDIKADKLEMDLSGAADYEGNVTATDLELDVSGASKIIRKEAENRYTVCCNRCEGSVSGASSVFIHCDGAICVDISGASNLHYTGNADTSGSDTSGASNLVHDVL